MTKVVGIMLASSNSEDSKSYADMVKACKETWISCKHPDVEVWATYGVDEPTEEADLLTVNEEAGDLIVNTLEHRANLLHKTLVGIEWALRRYPEAEYIFRPNCGSYINTHLLYDHLMLQQKSDYYSAIFGIDYNKIPFCSGSCILLSRDIAQLLVDNIDQINLDGWIMMDDVSIGKFLHESGIERVDGAKRVNVRSQEELDKKFDREVYHHYFCHTINPLLIYQTHKLFGY